MRFQEIINSPIKALIHMERYVNKGSPSGYTFKSTPSKLYAPLSGSDSFPLPYYLFSLEELRIFGEKLPTTSPLAINSNGEVGFPIHPDMINLFSVKNDLEEFSRSNIKGNIEVAPLANGRTVFPIKTQQPLFIKLHYDGFLGRVFRALPYQKAVAGPEISAEITHGKEPTKIPKRIGFLCEPQARIKRCNCNEIQEIGVVFRECKPFPYSDHLTLIPFFALFSKDHKNPNDPLLIQQILRNEENPFDVIFNDIIRPLLEGYFFLTFNHGLIPELNAQNVLLETEKSGKIVRLIFRDMQGFYKDLSIREEKNLSLELQSFPYRCIDKSMANYFQRHSYCYDFKLGHYILDEIADFVEKDLDLKKQDFQRKVTQIFSEVAGKEGIDHFQPWKKSYGISDAVNKISRAHKISFVELNEPIYR